MKTSLEKQLACEMVKRANALGISITKLCRDANVSRRWFENFKHRAPRAVTSYINLEKKLSELEQAKSAEK